MNTYKLTPSENKIDKTFESLHWESQQWKSNLQLMEDELNFIDRLLNSYVFEPDTPNLFERLQEYQERLKQVHAQKKVIQERIAKHENDLGGILECTTEACCANYNKKHEILTADTVDCITDFQNLKAEIFSYASGILRKRKS
ncbi:hypothetical protein [Spongiimicrobium salis]|uniref:hypothetical protein n=1 Tax=Spongiimicrobium salis TaxID=1667022 RepID=UPI00374C9A8A